jgi:predicted nuclease of predicted toxin-antitoxin system
MVYARAHRLTDSDFVDLAGAHGAPPQVVRLETATIVLRASKFLSALAPVDHSPRAEQD